MMLCTGPMHLSVQEIKVPNIIRGIKENERHSQQCGFKPQYWHAALTSIFFRERCTYSSFNDAGWAVFLEWSTEMYCARCSLLPLAISPGCFNKEVRKYRLNFLGRKVAPWYPHTHTQTHTQLFKKPINRILDEQWRKEIGSLETCLPLFQYWG